MTVKQISTKVCIIGAGAAGLLVGNILQKYGIPCLIVEKYSQSEIQSRSRLGLIDSQTVDILKKYDLGDRLLEEGLAQAHCEFCTPDQSFLLNYSQICDGQQYYSYPQQELIKDLMGKFQKFGGEILFNTVGVSLQNNSDGARVQCQHYGEDIIIDCDFIAGCDGFYGVTRLAIDQSITLPQSKNYDYAWLEITAEATTQLQQTVYGVHSRGFAGQTPYSQKISHYYLQIPVGNTVEDWSSDRIWSELQLRLAKQDCPLAKSKIVAKRVLTMNSYLTQTMQSKRLFLAGDAAHVSIPIGVKGINLATQDGAALAEALVSFYRYQNNYLLKSYSTIRFAQIWQAQEFSESLLHMINVQDQSHPKNIAIQQLQKFKLVQLMNSSTYAAIFAKNYVGYIAPEQPESKATKNINTMLEVCLAD